MAPTKERILRWMTEFSCTRYRPLIWGTLLLGALSLLLITRLQFQSDVLHLLPANAPTTGAFVKFLKEFGGADSLFLVLERKSGGEVESFVPFVDVLAERLVESGEFKEIQGRGQEAAREKMEREFIRKALLYLPEEDLRELEGKVTEDAIQQQIQTLKAKLHSPFGSFPGQWAARDPLNLWPLFQRHIPSEGRFASAGYLLSPDRKMMILIAKPKGSASDVRYDEMLLEKVQAAEQAAKEAFAEGKNISAENYFRDLKISLAGGYMTALEDSQAIKRELLRNFFFSFGGVMTLFVLAFRRRVSIFYALFPLLMSPLLTLGLFSPFLGRFSESTGAFSVIILGLSIDFIILLYGRYLEERNAGQGIREALERTLGKTGPGVLIGAATTAAAYFALLFSDFRGVRELGVLTGTGILLSLVSAFLLFPALVAWKERGEQEEKPFRAVSSFHLERLSLLSLKRPLWVIFLVAAMTIGTLGFVFQVKLNNDPGRLRPKGYPSLVVEEQIRKKMGEGLETLVVLAESQRMEEALEVQGILRDKFEAAMASGLPVSRYESLAAFIPPLSRQKRNIEWIQARERGAFDPEAIEKSIRKALQKEGLRLEPFAPGLKMLREMLANREMLTWQQFQDPFLKEVEGRFLKKNGKAFILASYLHVGPGFWADPRATNFLRELEETGPNIQITGAKLVQKELEDLMRKEAWKVLLIALCGVYALIYLSFRSWQLSLLSLLPVVLASLWTLGLMGIAGMDLNFMNLMVFTMVLGVGVDYGLHILYRGLESGKIGLEAGLAQVGKGVVLAALTTLVGFGSLVISGYPGLQSMGAVALMGVGFSALIAMTLVPVLLQKLLPEGPSS